MHAARHREGSVSERHSSLVSRNVSGMRISAIKEMAMLSAKTKVVPISEAIEAAERDPFDLVTESDWVQLPRFFELGNMFPRVRINRDTAKAR